MTTAKNEPAAVDFDSAEHQSKLAELSRTTASSVCQVFDGTGTATIGDETFEFAHGDVFAVPAWQEFDIAADDDLDLFTFADAPILEKLALLRTETTTS